MDPYSTHIPVTALALHMTGKLFPGLPILECGCGDYSTPMIELLKGGRRHDILSCDPTWSDMYQDVADKIIPVQPIAPHRWGEYSLDDEYGLCLLDSEELTVYRRGQVPRLLESCRVVVMHDASAPLMQLAEFSYMYNRYAPWTWVGSNHVDVRQWFDRETL